MGHCIFDISKYTLDLTCVKKRFRSANDDDGHVYRATIE